LERRATNALLPDREPATAEATAPAGPPPRCRKPPRPRPHSTSHQLSNKRQDLTPPSPLKLIFGKTYYNPLFSTSDLKHADQQFSLIWINSKLSFELEAR